MTPFHTNGFLSDDGAHVFNSNRFLTPILLTLWLTSIANADWLQWGGRNRNFELSGVKLASKWPAGGPKRLWSKKLGDGYSSILVAGKRLVTMYRVNNREHIVALDRASGTALWTHSYGAPFLKGTDVKQFGPGPLATPLIVGNRVIAVGVTGMLHCVTLDSGKVIWKTDLVRQLKGTNLYRGYSASPIAHDGLTILPVGGKGQGLVAFRIKSGSIAWRKHDFSISHVSPIYIQVDKQRQLVVTAAKLIAGFEPSTGRMLWQHQHPIRGGYISSTPHWGKDGRLFFSAAYGAGSRCLQLINAGGGTLVKETWVNGKMRVHHSNVIRVGDIVYGVSGDFSVMLFMAINIRSGKLLWKKREPGRSRMIYADGKFIILREDGILRLATMDAKGMKVLASTKVFDGRGWTGPTLDRNILYLRNRQQIMAFELP